MAFGIMDTTYLDLPENVDRAYVEGLTTASGVTFERVLREIDSRLTTFNGGLDPLLASLIYPTPESFTEAIRPVAFDVQEAGEYTMARPQFTEGAGIMLPIRKWDVATGWTEDGLLEMSMNSIMVQIDSILLGLKTRARREIMRRLFSDAEVRIDRKSTATNPGFAGSGTGLNVFSDPLPSGADLPGGYTHYIRDTEANRGLALSAARDRVRTWHSGPYDFIGSASEVAAIKALPGFVPVGSALVRQAPDQPEAMVDPNVYVGVYDGDIQIRKPIDDFTTAHGAVFKSFGQLNTQNALAWRYDDRAGRGRDAYLRSRSLFPLHNAEVLQRFGIGVSNRTAAAVYYLAASGAYTPPAIP